MARFGRFMLGSAGTAVLAAVWATMPTVSGAGAGAANGVPTPQQLKEQLGKHLFFDANLSEPKGQACASCHSPDAGFADPRSNLPVSTGALAKRFGNRNAPSAAYMAYSPPLSFDEEKGLYFGGQFWDGRADDLVAQAKGPFLNPLEMHNPTKNNVIKTVQRSAYADLFRQVYGADALDARNVEAAYDQVAEAIATYESGPEVNRFDSKFDYFRKGKVTLTDQEMRGMALFNGKGQCSLCHVSTTPEGVPGPLFTDFTYDNLGIPKNLDNPFLKLPRSLNPDGENYVDRGLGGVLDDPEQDGKFKVPTLRNIAVTAPYGHNGYFKTLKEIVDFYNTRDVPEANWPKPEVEENVNTSEMGNLGLTAEEVEDIVKFMETLTDGYKLPAAPAARR